MEKGEVLHSKEVKDGLQTDTIKISIPFSAISDKGLKLLNLWMAEEFYYGKIDWKNQEITCVYETQHFLPNIR